MPKILPKSRLALPDRPVRLDGFRLDWGRLRLTDAEGTETKLTPKAGAVLATLLLARGRTVSRAELFDAAWSGSPSSDEVLTQVVQELRRAFADRQREPAWLVTVPKLGYRWEGPEPVDDVADVPGSAPIRHRRLPAAAWLALLAAGALGAAWYFLDAPDRPAPLPRAFPLVREPARESDPHLAGDALVYVREDDTGFEIRRRTLPGGDERTLVSATDATLGAPRISRAADRVAYLRRTPSSCELRIVALAGGTETTLLDDCPRSLATTLDWSQDDAWIYYTRSGSGPAVAQHNLAIHRIRVADGKVERISDAGRWLSTDIHPRLHGDTLAFVRDGDGRNRVVTMPAGGGAETELAYPQWPYRVEWSGDDFVLAMHGTTGLELWRSKRDGTLDGMLAGEGAGPGVSVGPDLGIVFERHRADDNLWRLELGVAEAQPAQLTQETGSEHSPRVSPDGRSLAYLSDAGGDVEVHVLDLATNTRRAWSRVSPRVPLDMSWSPRGDRMVLILGTERGKRVALLEADGTLATLPAALADLLPAQVAWDASGDLWIATERDGRRELVRLRGPEFARAELVVDGSIASFAQDADATWLWRPNGAHFVTLDGTRRLALPAIATPSNQWTVRGDWVAQAVQTGGAPSRIELARATGSETVRVVPVRLPEPPLGRPMDLGDGVLFYGQRDRVESDLYRLAAPPRR